jgi:hypothetical protein
LAFHVDATAATATPTANANHNGSRSSAKIQPIASRGHPKIASDHGIFNDHVALDPLSAISQNRFPRRRRKPQDPAGTLDSDLAAFPVDSVFHDELSEGRKTAIFRARPGASVIHRTVRRG